jgi:uncharacterized protein involved in exopolysaccharide biosynthesis/Mrp family chromosome partitioning ATPase
MNSSLKSQELMEPIQGAKERMGAISTTGKVETGRTFSQRIVAFRRPLELSLNSLLQLPFVYFRLIAGCILIAGVLTWIALLAWPRSYQSEAKILILVGRESVSLDPTVTTSQTLFLQKTQEEEINSALDILTSRAVADKVVEKIGAEAILDGYLPSEGTGSASTFEIAFDKVKSLGRGMFDTILLTSGLRDPLSNHELAVMRVLGALEIEAPKKSTTITIHAESKSPAMAQAIAQTVMDTFMEQHLIVTKTKGSKQFFTTQKIDAEKSLHELLTNKSLFMTERKIVSVDANRTLLKDQLGAIDRDLIVAVGDLTQTKAEIDELRRGKDGLASEIVASKLEASDNTWSGMRQRVYELELLEQSQAAIYTEAHPTLMKTREQLDGARAILEKLDSERMDESTTPNPVVLQMEEQLQLRLAKLEGLKSIIEEKKSQKMAVEDQIRELLEVEVTLTRMDNEIAVATSKLRQFSEKENEAMVIDELQAERITNVSIFQPASFVERALKPNKPLLAAAGIMMGLMGGIGLAFLKEISAKTIRSVEQAEQILKQPVIGKIKRAKHPPIRVGRKTAMTEELRRDCGGIVSQIMMGTSTNPTAEDACRMVGVLGIHQGAGASTVALALSITAVHDFGLKTILIDGNSSNGELTSKWAKKGVAGLKELVEGDVPPLDCLQPLDETGVEFVATSADNKTTLSKSSGWKGRLAAMMQWKQHCELIVIDLSSADAMSQATVLASKLDGIIVVAESGKTESGSAEAMFERLHSGNATIYGIVLNKMQSAVPQWFENLLGLKS